MKDALMWKLSDKMYQGVRFLAHNKQVSLKIIPAKDHHCLQLIIQDECTLINYTLSLNEFADKSCNILASCHVSSLAEMNCVYRLNENTEVLMHLLHSAM